MSAREIAVVTGAASGIGRGLVHAAVERGCKVWLIDINQAQLQDAAQEVEGDTATRVVDVCDQAAVDALAAEVFACDGRVDYLFNNAGILRGGLCWEITADDWRRTLDVNVMGVVHGLRSFVARMTATGLPCHVVNTASIGGLVTAPMITPYAASKFAVMALTEALMVELQIQGSAVRAHVLAPGTVRSAIYASAQRSNGPGSENAVKRMQAFTEETGMDPLEFARFVFRGIERDEFWIISHPELWEDALAARTDRILARENPTPAHFNFDPRD